jgi:very-short-patch-repair endonuclease
VGAHEEYLRRITRWLREHGGVLTADDARRLGVPLSTLRRLAATGRLVRVFHGVYADGSRPMTPALLLRCAVAFGGADAVASHASAAWVWGMHERPPAVPSISVPVRRNVRASGITVHRCVLAGATTTHRGLPVTTPARTLVDLAAAPKAEPERIADLVDEALVRRWVTVPSLLEAITTGRGRCRPGAMKLRDAMELRGHLDRPGASALERHLGKLLQRMCRQHGLPYPQVELEVLGGRYRLDFAWPHLRLAVEADGWAWHAAPGARAHDDDRRNALARAAWLIMPFTWMKVRHSPDAVVAEVLDMYRWREAELAGDR